jgi:hypothetical protein
MADAGADTVMRMAEAEPMSASHDRLFDARVSITKLASETYPRANKRHNHDGGVDVGKIAATGSSLSASSASSSSE